MNVQCVDQSILTYSNPVTDNFKVRINTTDIGTYQIKVIKKGDKIYIIFTQIK
jgi:hypothetical protein